MCHAWECTFIGLGVMSAKFSALCWPAFRRTDLGVSRLWYSICIGVCRWDCGLVCSEAKTECENRKQLVLGGAKVDKQQSVMRRVAKPRSDSDIDLVGNHHDALEEEGAASSTSPPPKEKEKRHEEQIVRKQVTITVQPGVKPKPASKKKRPTPSDLVRFILC